MKRRFLYYSLVAVMAASAVTFSSCDKDDDKDTNNTTTTTTTTDNTEKEEKKEVEKFSVTVNLNGESILSQQVEVGQKFTLNLDELTKNPLTQEALKGYEILSITQDGKEVSGNIEISAEAKYEINAVKYANLEFKLHNQEGKILHSSYRETNEPLKKDAPQATYQSDSWICPISDNSFYEVYRNYWDESTCYGDGTTYYYEQETGKVYIYVIGKNVAKGNEYKQYESYFFKNGDKYYDAAPYRYVKKEGTTKGYQTEWTPEEEKNEKLGKQLVARPINSNITISGEKFISDENNYTYEYENGIITIEDGTKYIYDGTYLYQIYNEYSIEDYKPLPTGKLLNIEEINLDNSINKNVFRKVDDDVNVYMDNEDEYNDDLYGFYDWDKSNSIEYEEFNWTTIINFDEYPFGEFSLQHTLYRIFPDNKIYIFLIGGLYDIKENTIFTDGNYIAIDVSKYDESKLDK